MSDNQVSGELVIHYADDTYRLHWPCSIDLDEMRAELEEVGEYWEPEEPIEHGWEEDSWEEVVFDGGSYPAVRDYDSDGYDHMMNRYNGEFVIVSSPE